MCLRPSHYRAAEEGADWLPAFYNKEKVKQRLRIVTFNSAAGYENIQNCFEHKYAKSLNIYYNILSLSAAQGGSVEKSPKKTI